ncbi:hypothetical protein CAPTEDRAFT_209741, partial [Capitella teleta]
MQIRENARVLMNTGFPRHRIRWIMLILALTVAVASVLDALSLMWFQPVLPSRQFVAGEFRHFASDSGAGDDEEEIPWDAFSVSETESIGYATLLNLSSTLQRNVSYTCAPNAWIPKIKVCLFPESRDRLVSRQISKSGTWEERNTAVFIAIMAQYPQLDLIDIGANLGQYSLLAAGMRRKVVSVEPYAPSTRRLAKSYDLNGFNGSDVVLIKDAISDHRGSVTLRTWRHTQSAVMVATGNLSSCDPPCLVPTSSILMDDLLPVIRTKFPNMSEIFLKMDIEGHEHKALNTSNNLFSKQLVAFILMEWVGMKQILAGRLGSKQDILEVYYMVQGLKHRGYDHYFVNKRALISQQFRLPDSMWEHWPDE